MHIDPQHMRTAACRVLILLQALLLGSLGLLSLPAQSMDTRGQIRIGAYTRTVTFKEAVLGETNNDEYVISSQVKLDLLNLTEDRGQVLFEVRDKIDNFGKLERENLRLTSYNRFQVRTAAYRKPWENNRFYYTVGRFQLSEANIRSHDGAELGYRYSREIRTGLFVGQGPEDILTPLYVDPETQSVNNMQAGAYVTYDTKVGAEDSSYLTQAIAQAPSYDITDAENHAYYYQQGMWTFTPTHRLVTQVLYDVSPNSQLRRGYVSYTYLTEKYRAMSYFQQTTTEDYLIKQTLEDSLVPSAVQSLNFELRHRYSPTFSLDYSLSYGRRSADGLTRTEYALGTLFPRLFSSSGSARAQFGIRNNFQSKENFLKVGYDYWSRSFGLGVSHVINNENYEDGTKNTRQISLIDMGFFFFDDFRGSLGYQREQDKSVQANAMFVMVGYRFGSGAVSPVRTKPARFEAI